MRMLASVLLVLGAVQLAHCADRVTRIVASSSNGVVYVTAQNDEQARRKIAQGNFWGLSLNTNGTVHCTGAVTKDGRIRLVNKVRHDELLRQGWKSYVEPKF